MTGVRARRRWFGFWQPVNLRRANIIPGLWTRFDQAPVFQEDIRLHHCADADALLFAHLTHRGDAIAGAVRALVNEFGDAAGDLSRTETCFGHPSVGSYPPLRG